jgi:hypothetical protein
MIVILPKAILITVTGNREQGTGNREQGTGNREQGRGFGEFYFSLLMSVFFRSLTYFNNV